MGGWESSLLPAHSAATLTHVRTDLTSAEDRLLPDSSYVHRSRSSLDDFELRLLPSMFRTRRVALRASLDEAWEDRLLPRVTQQSRSGHEDMSDWESRLLP